ncbi:MAG: glycosyltransferase [Gemmatimonadota bacterium]
MTDPGIYLSVVIPVYNGADQLPASLDAIAAYAARQSRTFELILVDDHGDSASEALLVAFAASRPWVTLLRNEQNQGKGYSVSRGMLAARGRYRVFTDADLAYPIEEVDKIVRQLETSHDVAVACRVLPESRYLMSPTFFHYLYTRHLMSRFFNALVRWFVIPGMLDTQAGLKGFSDQAAQRIFPLVTIPGFGFDVECLFIATRLGLRIHQTPVYFRYDSEPTTVRFTNDALQMIRDLVTIRRNGARGLYG